MVRPITIDDADLLRAAREVFLARGVQATTAEVAKRAKVSEGILFHRFGSKAKLFQAAMSFPDRKVLLDDLALQERAGEGDLSTQMCIIAERLMDFFLQLMPCIMMNWASRLESVRVAGRPSGFGPTPLTLERDLASYFEAEMRAGRLRRIDPEILARAFMGGVVEFAFGEVVGQGTRLSMPKDKYVRELVDLLINGVGSDATNASLQHAARRRARTRTAGARRETACKEES